MFSLSWILDQNSVFWSMVWFSFRPKCLILTYIFIYFPNCFPSEMLKMTNIHSNINSFTTWEINVIRKIIFYLRKEQVDLIFLRTTKRQAQLFNWYVRPHFICTPLRWVSFAPIDKWWNWDSENINYLLKVAQLPKDRVKFRFSSVCPTTYIALL